MLTSLVVVALACGGPTPTSPPAPSPNLESTISAEIQATNEAAPTATAATKVSSNTVDCKTEPTLRSLDSSVTTFINFTNSSTSTLRIYWLNYQGLRQHYEFLQPSESYWQPTFVTHPWVVTELSGRCLAIYIPTERPISAVLDSSLLE